MLKAFAVQEDCEGTGDIYYAEHSITAKKRFANEFSDGELNGITCRRAPFADEFSPGPCPRLVLIDNGWWMDCHGCGVRIDSDLECFPDDPKEPVIVLKPVEDNRGLFCTEECRDRHIADKAARKEAEDVARVAIEARILAKIPGVVVEGKTHIYVVKRDGVYVPQQSRVGFTFPGSKIGPATFGHDKVGEEPTVSVCAGDLPAWEAWRAELSTAATL